MDTRQDWSATLLGDGPLSSEMAEFIASRTLSERVNLPGFKSGADLDAYLRTADVFLSPMTDTVIDWARCPGKTFIYMMYRRPIVTCRIGENWAALGEDAFYYEPGDVNSMVTAIDRALSAAPLFAPNYDLKSISWETRATTYLDWLADARTMTHRDTAGTLVTREVVREHLL